jgi:predicted GNAT superfamily acetyltransferase
VNGVPPEKIAWFAERAPYFRVADEGGTVAGFLIAMTPGVAYDCENFEWFRARYDSFVYVDRIVVAEEARGRGVGKVKDLTAGG